MLRIVLRFALTVILLWILSKVLSDYLTIVGSGEGLLVIAAVITILNMIVRPILTVLTFPLRLFSTLPAIILANAIFLWITVSALRAIGSGTLQINRGIIGWLVVSICFGVGNGIIRILTKERDRKRGS
jgi:putative membrane protein